MLGCGDDEDKRALREKVAVLERRVAELERAKSNEELELGWLRQEQCTQEGLQQPPPPPAAAGSFPIPPSFKCPITQSMMQDPWWTRREHIRAQGDRGLARAQSDLANDAHVPDGLDAQF